eukprot:465659_1
MGNDTVFHDHSDEQLKEAEYGDWTYNGRQELNRERDKRRKKKEKMEKERQEYEEEIRKKELEDQRYVDNLLYQQKQEQLTQLTTTQSIVNDESKAETQPFKDNHQPESDLVKYVKALERRNYERRDREFEIKKRKDHQAIPTDISTDDDDDDDDDDDEKNRNRDDNNKEQEKEEDKTIVFDNYLVFTNVLLFLDYLLNLGVGFVFMFGTRYGMKGYSCNRNPQSGIYYPHWIFIFVLSTVGFFFWINIH